MSDEQTTPGEVDALTQAKRNMAWKDNWRRQANLEANQDMHDHQVEMEDVCRADAIAYAAIAQAEYLARIAEALENLSGAYTAVQFGRFATSPIPPMPPMPKPPASPHGVITFE